MEKAVLVEKIKQWLEIENEISNYSKKLKELRATKKELSDTLVDVMKSNEIDCFDCNSGKIMYSQNKVRKGINKKYLMETLTKYMDDGDEAGKLCQFIMENRQQEVKESVRLKRNKV